MQSDYASSSAVNATKLLLPCVFRRRTTTNRRNAVVWNL